MHTVHEHKPKEEVKTEHVAKHHEKEEVKHPTHDEKDAVTKHSEIKKAEEAAKFKEEEEANRPMTKAELLAEQKDPKSKKKFDVLLKESNHYTADITCVNCGYAVEGFVIKQGESVVDGAGNLVCTNCGIKGVWARTPGVVRVEKK